VVFRVCGESLIYFCGGFSSFSPEFEVDGAIQLFLRDACFWFFFFSMVQYLRYGHANKLGRESSHDTRARRCRQAGRQTEAEMRLEVV